jgi:hypothetical protein
VNFIFIIDGIQIQHPDGWYDFTQEIIRDDEERIIRYDYPIKLTFYGDGHDLIEAKYQEAYNSIMTLQVFKSDGPNMTLFVQAIIKMSNCIWSITRDARRGVEVEIDDIAFQAYYFANRKTPIGVGGALTLLGEAVTPVPLISLTLFTNGTGADDYPGRTAYDIKDVMAYFISVVTENQCTFESTWYDNLPDDQRLCILTGIDLRDPTQAQIAPIINLEDFFAELWRKFNLYLVIESPIQNPVIRLEDQSYVFGNTKATEINFVEGLTRSLDFEQLYGKVKIGSDKFIKEFGNNFQLYYLPFLAFVEENYSVQSPIATEKELLLMSNFVIDNNAIVNALENNSTEFDEEIFLIQYDRTTAIATKGTYFPTLTPSNRFYNEQLLNSNVLARFNLLGNAVMNSGLQDTDFLASTTTPENGTVLVAVANPSSAITAYDNDEFPFQDDSTPPNFDTGNNYDNTTFEFTAPISGFYRFQSAITVEFFGYTGGINFNAGLLVAFFRNGTTQITDTQALFRRLQFPNEPAFEIPQNPLTGALFSTGLNPGSFLITSSFTIFLEQNDTLSTKVKLSIFAFQTGSLNFSLYGTFANILSPITGGIYEGNNPDLLYVGEYEAEGIPISDTQWDDILANPQGFIQIDTDGTDKRIAYIKNMTRNVNTGDADFILTFNRNQAIK